MSANSSHSRQSSLASLTDYSWFSAPQNRYITLTKTIPYSPTTAFTALSDIASYERATSLIYSSRVTAKDAAGLPISADLQIGYPPLGLSEDWKCQVRCDHKAGVVESKNAPASEGGYSTVLESYIMRWTISPIADEPSQTSLKLEMEVKFKGYVVDSMFSVLQPVTASRTMMRYEALVKAQHERQGVRRSSMTERQTSGIEAEEEALHKLELRSATA